jgi:hypothetical protein
MRIYSVRHRRSTCPSTLGHPVNAVKLGMGDPPRGNIDLFTLVTSAVACGRIGCEGAGLGDAAGQALGQTLAAIDVEHERLASAAEFEDGGCAGDRDVTAGATRAGGAVGV